MTYFPAAVILPGCLLLFFQGCWSRSHFSPSADASCISTDNEDKISCLIINREYIKCNWNKLQQINYTFSSVFSSDSFRECPEYLQEHGQNVGCRIPLEDSQRFGSFYTKLSVGGNQLICKNYTDLRSIVKLNPPYNVSVKSSGRDSEVCAHWNGSHKNCENFSVSYQKASDPWKNSKPVHSSPYCVSPVSSGVMYTFRVKSGMADYCGSSHFWSDWSDQVQWIDPKSMGMWRHHAINNETDTAQPQTYWHVLAVVLGVITFIGLSLLLYYSEQVKVVFVPATPDPSKSLQDLFKKYKGNVESWVNISRELKDAFEPDFTESPCVVCEPSPTFESKTEEGPMKQPVS